MGTTRTLCAVVALWDADGESDGKDGEKPMKKRKGDRGRRRTEAWEKGRGDSRKRKALLPAMDNFRASCRVEQEGTVINALSDTVSQFAIHITREEALPYSAGRLAGQPLLHNQASNNVLPASLRRCLLISAQSW